MPLGQSRQAGDRGACANVPGVHISQKAWSTSVDAQPAGQVPHQGCCAGGTGQPAAVT